MSRARRKAGKRTAGGLAVIIGVLLALAVPAAATAQPGSGPVEHVATHLHSPGRGRARRVTGLAAYTPPRVALSTITGRIRAQRKARGKRPAGAGMPAHARRVRGSSTPTAGAGSTGAATPTTTASAPAAAVPAERLMSPDDGPAAGTIVTVAGSTSALPADDVATTADGDVYMLSSNSTVSLINSDGTVTSKYTDTSSGNTWRRFGVSPDGHIFLEGYYGYGVAMVKPDGTFVQNTDCGTGEDPTGVAVANDGTAYVVANGGVCVIGVDGSLNKYLSFDGADTAGLALDTNGNLWALTYTVGSDGQGDSVYQSFGLEELQSNGQLRVVATNLPLATPPYWSGSTYSGVDLAVDAAGNVFFTEGDDYIYERRTDGTVVTIAGTGQAPVQGQGNGDGGPATAAAVNAGTLAVDSSGNLYLTESYGFDDADRVREIVGASTVGGSFPRTGPTTTTVASYPVSGLGPTETVGGTNPSERCVCGQRQATANPVDTATGAFWHTFDDMQTAGRGPALGITRTYDSTLAGQDGLFGYGWSSDYGMALTADASTGDITVNQEDGSEIAFQPSGTDYVPVQPRELATLVANSDGTYTFTRQSRQVFTFTSTGQLAGISDLDGNTTSLSYDTSGNLTNITEAGGRSYAIGTTNGRITSVTDGARRTCTYAYDQDGNLTSATDPTGATWTYTYDPTHHLLTMLDPDQQGAANPHPLTNTYDTSGRVSSQSDYADRTTSFDYGSIAGATKVTDPAGDVTVDYYSDGLRSKTTTGYGTSAAASTSFTYDPATEAVATETDPLGNLTSYSYDGRGNLLTLTDPLHRTTTNTYDSLDDLLTSTDAAGVTTTDTYDATGDLLTTSTPLLSGTTVAATATTTYTYGDTNHPGDVTATTDPDGHTTSYTYDAYGDLTSMTDALGNRTTYGYDADTGMRTSITSPRGNAAGANPASYTTTYVYDPDGRVTAIRDSQWSASNPTPHQSTATYDADGNQLTSTDGVGSTTSYGYDADSELVTTTNPMGYVTRQAWTADGQLASTTDPLGAQVSYTYTPRGQVATSSTPKGEITSYSYDPDGNLTVVAAPGADCSGTPSAGCTSYSYDDDGEQTGTSYLDGATHAITYSYDADGQRTGMSDATGASSYSYDSLGRLTSATDGHGTVTNYGYDLDGNLTSLTYPGAGHTLTRTFDAAGRLATLTDWLGNQTDFGYDADSDQTTITFPASTGETDTSNYNQLDLLSSTTDTRTADGQTSTLAEFTYTHLSNHKIANTTTTGPTEVSFPQDHEGFLMPLPVGQR